MGATAHQLGQYTSIEREKNSVNRVVDVEEKGVITIKQQRDKPNY